jgi:virginiamycin B lyase
MVKSALVLAAAALSLAVSPSQAQQGGQQRQLPDGPGKEIVQASCGSCHGVNQIFGSAGYDEAGWRNVFNAMIALPEAEASQAASYLARNFPPQAGVAPTRVAGNNQVKITEWIAPTLGQRVRDPLEARDGAIWWTGMFASLVGRRDPQTGEMREYKLPNGARPHGITEDPQGNIWYTGNGNATVGVVNARTGEVTEYKTQARDPHTPQFHPNGNLYWTAQGARMVGRLNPRTGQLTEVQTANANPYGLQIAPDGTLWIAFNGPALDRPGGSAIEGARLASMNPETMELTYYELPDPASRVRRLALDSEGMVWFVNSSQGRLGRLNPATREVKEWPSPSGPQSHPYAIAVVDDVVWYNESGKRPDTLVRFDPKTESFQSFAIPSGVGIIRNMFVTRAGNLLIHQSSSNRFGLVEIVKPLSQ